MKDNLWINNFNGFMCRKIHEEFELYQKHFKELDKIDELMAGTD